MVEVYRDGGKRRINTRHNLKVAWMERNDWINRNGGQGKEKSQYSC